MSKKYHNRSYWLELHESFSGSLRAVGWPTLSEALNELKYQSESEAFTRSFSLSIDNRKLARVLEVGVGIGFWTTLAKAYASENNITLDYSALDISSDALRVVHERYPDVTCIESDLTQQNASTAVEKYDVVTAIMVLLHLTNFNDYQKALEFCAASVDEGGALIIYEPFLLRNYSPFISKKYSQFKGNSFTQLKFQIDNILDNLGFDQVAMMPGTSWLLNAPIQAGSKWGFFVKQAIWLVLYGSVFKSEKLTKALRKPLRALDALLKRGNGDSGIFVVYRKRNV